MNNELKRMWDKKAFVARLSYYPNIFQEVLRKTTKPPVRIFAVPTTQPRFKTDIYLTESVASVPRPSCRGKY